MKQDLNLQSWCETAKRIVLLAHTTSARLLVLLLVLLVVLLLIARALERFKRRFS